MTHNKSLVIAVLAILLCSSIARAQEREKAIDLLKSLATQLGTLQSPENRARIGANIADSLWAHDEKRARALFISIEEDINAGLRGRENKRADNSGMVFMQLRTDIVTRIAKHDAELALDFLTTTAPIYDNWPPDVLQRERDFELKLAAQIVASNPDLALKMGRESLSRGVSDKLLPLLKQLHKKHREQGITLYKETVRKLRDADFTRSRQQVDFARSLAEYLTPPVADELAFRELLNILIKEASANRCGKPNVIEEASYFCEQLRVLLPQMQKYAPVHAAQLKELAEEGVPESWQVANLHYPELQQALESGDLDDVLEIANKYPEMADAAYWQAVKQAQANGDMERARKIANDFNGDPEVKKQLMAQVNADDESSSLTEEELAQVQAELNNTTPSEERLRNLAMFANSIGARNRATALKLLDQAASMLDATKPGKEQVLSQFGLSLFYCVEKSDRGLGIMETLLPKLNELIDAAAKLDGFDTHYLRDGEWNMSADGPLGEMLNFLSQNASYYAWCDFDRAVSLAAQFERSEIRMMAQVKLAQGILAGPPKRLRY
jgi:hypothetical protein